MKKIFGISLVAVMMAMPMMANAAPVAGDPGATTAGATTAESAPKYTLKQDGANDGNAASAAYVKGAYNAVIKGVNKTHDEVGTLNTGITTYRNTINNLTAGKATQTGAVATIKAARTTEAINGSSVNISGVTTSSISATASGNVNLTMQIMGDWASDSAGTPIQTTTTFSGLNVDGITMSAPGANNTAQLTKTGISGTVDVANYIAQAAAAAATPYNYTPLISTGADSYGYKSADDSDSVNADDLELGGWKAGWSSYGTVKGISVCSSDWLKNGEEYARGEAISGTPASITDEDAPAGCWCKMTSFTEANDGPTHNDNSLWVYSYSYDTDYDCESYCADNCVEDFFYRSDFRSAVFGVE